MTDSQEPNATLFSVGQSVRIELPQSVSLRRPRTKRGIVATVNSQSQDVCALLAPLSATVAQGAKPILLLPPDHAEDDDEEEIEVTVSLDRVQPLLDFETTLDSTTDNQSSPRRSFEEWKSWGDALFQLGDEQAALFYYEHMLSKIPQIGSTVILQILSETRSAWQLWMVEVDCVESLGDDKTSLDVTVLARWDPWRRQLSTTSKEETLLLSSTVRVVLTISDLDQDDHYLERALLNATRCTLALAQESKETQHWKQASFYVHTSVLTTTCVDALLFYWKREGDVTDQDKKQFAQWQSTLHLLRAKAWLAMGQHDLALHDTNKTSAKEARALQKEIAEQKQASSVQTRKLVKDMCQWINGATTEEFKM